MDVTVDPVTATLLVVDVVLLVTELERPRMEELNLELVIGESPAPTRFTSVFKILEDVLDTTDVGGLYGGAVGIF